MNCFNKLSYIIIIFLIILVGCVTTDKRNYRNYSLTIYTQRLGEKLPTEIVDIYCPLSKNETDEYVFVVDKGSVVTRIDLPQPISVNFDEKNSMAQGVENFYGAKKTKDRTINVLKDLILPKEFTFANNTFFDTTLIRILNKFNVSDVLIYTNQNIDSVYNSLSKKYLVFNSFEKMKNHIINVLYKDSTKKEQQKFLLVYNPVLAFTSIAETDSSLNAKIIHDKLEKNEDSLDKKKNIGKSDVSIDTKLIHSKVKKIRDSLKKKKNIGKIDYQSFENRINALEKNGTYTSDNITLKQILHDLDVISEEIQTLKLNEVEKVKTKDSKGITYKCKNKIKVKLTFDGSSTLLSDLDIDEDNYNYYIESAFDENFTQNVIQYETINKTFPCTSKDKKWIEGRHVENKARYYRFIVKCKNGQTVGISNTSEALDVVCKSNKECGLYHMQ